MLPTASDPEFHSAHVLQFILQDVLMEAPFSKWWKFKLLRTSVDCGQKQGMNTQLLPPQTLCFKMNHFWFQSLLILYPHLDGIFTVYFCTTEQVFISEFSLAESFLCNSVQLPSPFRIYSGGKENNTDASIPPLQLGKPGLHRKRENNFALKLPRILDYEKDGTVSVTIKQRNKQDYGRNFWSFRSFGNQTKLVHLPFVSCLVLKGLRTKLRQRKSTGSPNPSLPQYF